MKATGLTQKNLGFLRELNAVVTVAARDITIAVKSPAMLIMSLAMPVLMMGMLGGTLMQNMANGLGFNFGQFMMIGMFVNMLFMMTTQGMTSLVDDHQTDFMQEMLVSPFRVTRL
jgi:ABC-2 type transport system permease protein